MQFSEVNKVETARACAYVRACGLWSVSIGAFNFNWLVDERPSHKRVGSEIAKNQYEKIMRYGLSTI